MHTEFEWRLDYKRILNGFDQRRIFVGRVYLVHARALVESIIPLWRRLLREVWRRRGIILNCRNGCNWRWGVLRLLIVWVELADWRIILLLGRDRGGWIELRLEDLYLILPLWTVFWLVMPGLEIAVWRMDDWVICLSSPFHNRIDSLDIFLPGIPMKVAHLLACILRTEDHVLRLVHVFGSATESARVKCRYLFGLVERASLLFVNHFCHAHWSSLHISPPVVYEALVPVGYRARIDAVIVVSWVSCDE